MRSIQYVSAGLTLMVCSGVVLAQPTPESEQRRPARMLSLGSQRGQAIKDYEAVYEQYLEWCKLPADRRNSIEQRPKRDRIVEDYRALVERYPQTEVAGMGKLDILRLYGGSDDMMSAESSYEDLLKSLAFTEYEMDAHMYLGLYWLQRKGSPGEAMKYFQAIPDPRDKPYSLVMPGGTIPSKPGELRREETLYVRAQLQVMRCNLKQGRLGDAEKTRASLINAYPEAIEYVNASMLEMKVEQFNLPVEARGNNSGMPSYSAVFDISDIRMEPWRPHAESPPSASETPTPAISPVPIPPMVAQQSSSVRPWLLAAGGFCLLLAGVTEVIRRRAK